MPTAARSHHTSTHLPALGRRGEGWVVAQVLLIAAVFLSALAGRGWSDTYRPVAWISGGVLVGAGLLMLVLGAVDLGRALTPLPAPTEKSELKTGGVYRLVRHPMYGGGLLIAFGWTLLFGSLPSLGFAVALAVFLGLKAHREEAWLVERFSDYDAYRQQTRHMLVPFIY